MSAIKTLVASILTLVLGSGSVFVLICLGTAWPKPVDVVPTVALSVLGTLLCILPPALVGFQGRGDLYLLHLFRLYVHDDRLYGHVMYRACELASSFAYLGTWLMSIFRLLDQETLLQVWPFAPVIGMCGGFVFGLASGFLSLPPETKPKIS